MSSFPALDAAELLRRHGLRPNKRLGQNFLQDPQVLEQITDAAALQRTDTVLEIGAGLGSLTRYLAAAAQRVVAVELDEKLIPLLKAVAGPQANVQIIHGDILELSPAKLIDRPAYVVVANIPYYITSAIIRHLLEPVPGETAGPRPRRIVLTVQREVAERICALPGDLSLLALSVQVYGLPRIVARIPAAAFYPPPEVDSALLVIDVHPQPRIAAEHLRNFFRLIKAGFGQKRKTLRNSLSAGLHLSPAQAEVLLRSVEIDPKRRAETLSLPEWERLAKLDLS
ncbi:MAG TPA: 16S rRNA (adenine(1518)-N(6)/adenine(1519)-N(6))-dimethyltransferase RsmA [Anaerolineales bacterium]|jgi:16S rRNA (adenine1518-N6/adenine1519-N6)-dimethyltransferase